MTQPRQRVEVVFHDDGYGRRVVRGLDNAPAACTHCGNGTLWRYVRHDLGPHPFCTIRCYQTWARPR